MDDFSFIYSNYNCTADLNVCRAKWLLKVQRGLTHLINDDTPLAILQSAFFRFAFHGVERSNKTFNYVHGFARSQGLKK